jgi:hypothetical protein
MFKLETTELGELGDCLQVTEPSSELGLSNQYID